MIRRLQKLRMAGRLTSTLVLLAVAMFWPSLSFGATGNFLFPAGDGSCYDVEPLENHSTLGAPLTDVDDVAGQTETEPVDSPCTVDDSDPASNVCLEAANSPISTLPRLIAEANGKETADSVVHSILDRMEQNDLEPVDVEVALTPTPEPTPVKDGSTVSCSTDSEECRSLPPVPPTLQLEASAPGARNIFSSIDLLDAPDDGRINAWAHLRVGPEDGHERRLERPPQRA